MFPGSFASYGQRFVLFIVILCLATPMSAGGDADRNAAADPATPQAANSATPPAAAPPGQGQKARQNTADALHADTQLFPPGIAATSLAANLNGSGSTLVSPALKIWQQEFGKLAPKVRINYQAGGSGQGRGDLLTGKTEFGVSDVQLSADEAQKTGHKLEDYLQIPATLAAIVLIYNLPDVPELHLSPQVLGDIYTGNIKKWNDQKIKQDNPEANLPDREIKFAVRADSSGTSEVFVTYLSAVSPDFKAKIGKPSGTPKWENVNINVTAASGNDGIAGLVKQSEGSLGYTEIAFAMQNKLRYATLKNRAGNFVKPSLETMSAAAESVKPDANLKVNLVDQPGQNAYPITTTTYFLLNQQYKNKAQGQAVVAFAWFALHQGGEMAKRANYAPLPEELRQQVEDKLNSVIAGGTTPGR